MYKKKIKIESPLWSKPTQCFRYTLCRCYLNVYYTFAGILVHIVEVDEDVAWRGCVVRGGLQDDDQLLLPHTGHALRREAPHNPVHTTVHWGRREGMVSLFIPCILP